MQRRPEASAVSTGPRVPPSATRNPTPQNASGFLRARAIYVALVDAVRALAKQVPRRAHKALPRRLVDVAALDPQTFCAAREFFLKGFVGVWGLNLNFGEVSWHSQAR